VVAFAPLYLTEAGDLGGATASALYSLFFLASVVQLGAGELSDRIGTMAVILTALSVSTLSLLGLLWVTPTGNPFLLGVTVVGIGAGAHAFRPVRGVYLVSILPDDVAGGGLGIVRTSLMGAGALSAALVGTLSDVVGFRAAFAVLAGAGVAAVVITVWLVLAAPEANGTDRATDGTRD
jgi:MFS family permease